MGWEPRDTAPPTFGLAAAFRTLVTGEAQYSWLDQFLPLIGAETIDTTAFCRAGPPAAAMPPDLTEFVYYPAAPGDMKPLLGQSQMDAIRKTAMDRVFGAYCHYVTVEGSNWCHFIDLHWNPPSSGYEFPFGGGVYTPGPSPVTNLRYHGTGTFNPGGGAAFEIATAAGPPTQYGFDFILDGQEHFHGISFGIPTWYIQVNGAIGPLDLVVEYDCPGNGGVEDYTPTAPTPPAGLITRAPTAATLEAIAAELDSQETKLDFLWGGMQYLTKSLAIPTDPDPTEIEAPPGVALNVENAAGAVVTLSLIRPGANEHFGTPPTFTKLGEIVFSGHGGHGPVVELRTNPHLVFPMPPGAQEMTVNALPPATATVKLIPKLK